MMNFLVFIGLLVCTIAGSAHSQTKVQARCKPDNLRRSSCFHYMVMGYCTDTRYRDFMKAQCSTMCGYCCVDGTLADKPFNKGCPDSDFCANMDRLTLLSDTTKGNNTCLRYYDKGINSSYPWVKYYCETTFRWCCMDKKTFADASEYKGCPYKLCYNVHSDQFCLNETKSIKNYCNAALTRHKCAWTCKNCKPKSPSECGVNGCCWNGVPAIRPDKKDCPICKDLSTHVCRQFKHACLPTGQYRLRAFGVERCPLTCSLCTRRTIG